MVVVMIVVAMVMLVVEVVRHYIVKIPKGNALTLYNTLITLTCKVAAGHSAYQRSSPARSGTAFGRTE